jgi:hypothetical protein
MPHRRYKAPQDEGAPAPEAILEAQGRLACASAWVNIARTYLEQYQPNAPFGTRMEGLIVRLTVAVGHLSGKPHTAASLARYLHAPRTTVLRALNRHIALGNVVRRGRCYFLNPEGMNSPSALATHHKVMGFARRAQAQLSRDN